MNKVIDKIEIKNEVYDLGAAATTTGGSSSDPGEAYTGKSLDSLTWAEISVKCKARDFSDIHVGDFKTIDCGTNGILTARIIGINTYRGKIVASQSVPDHIDFMADSAPLSGGWSSLSYSRVPLSSGTEAEPTFPWLKSQVYDILNNLIYGFLPQELKDVIISKIGLLDGRYSKNGEDLISLQWKDIGKLWIPTEYEVFGTNYHSKNYGCMEKSYEYFNDKKYSLNGKPLQRMLRDVDSKISSYCMIGSNGFSELSSILSSRVFPICFRVS